MLRHDETMLELPWAFAGLVPNLHLDIAVSLANMTTAFPVPVPLTNLVWDLAPATNARALTRAVETLG
jgi:hypothetical protein